MKSILTRFLVLAAALVAVASAKATPATNVPQYKDGDLLIGFYDASLSGTEATVNTNDYLVDLGPIKSGTNGGFDFHTSFVISTGTSHMGADLTHVFGTSWYTGGNVVFGLAISFPLTAQVFVTDPNFGNADAFREAANQSGPAQAVANIGGAYSGSGQSNSETDPRGLQQSDGSTNSWASVAGMGNGLGSYFGSNGDNNISDVASTSGAATNLEFMQLDQTSPSGHAGTALGYFTLDSAGDLSFTTASIPEPSTYAAVAMGAGVLLFGRRRRA